MPSGPSPAGRLATTACACMSITETVRSSGFETNTRPAPPATATPAGERPTRTVATTRCCARSITETSWLRWLVM
jgi:hypothetical protein